MKPPAADTTNELVTRQESVRLVFNLPIRLGFILVQGAFFFFLTTSIYVFPRNWSWGYCESLLANAEVVAQRLPRSRPLRGQGCLHLCCFTDVLGAGSPSKG